MNEFKITYKQFPLHPEEYPILYKESHNLSFDSGELAALELNKSLIKLEELKLERLNTKDKKVRRNLSREIIITSAKTRELQKLIEIVNAGKLTAKREKPIIVTQIKTKSKFLPRHI